MGSTDYSFDGFEEWEQALSKAIATEYPAEFEQMVLDVASQLRNRVRELTPVKTGTLRREWQVGEIIKKGNEYYIEVYNNTEYIESVEHGHRQEVGRYVPAIGRRLKKGFVPGAHMMEISMAELNNSLPDYLRTWLNDFLTTHEI